MAVRTADMNAFRAAVGRVGSAPAPAPKKKVKPMIQNFPVVGSGALELNVPIKGASALYEAAYVSIRSTKGGTADVWWGMTGKGGRGEEHWKALPANGRVWVELKTPDMADQCTIHYNFGKDVLGVIGLEMAPK